MKAHAAVLAPLVAGAFLASATAGQVLAADNASVRIVITVSPLAEIEFPHGTDFLLTVPRDDDDHDHHGWKDHDWNYGWGDSHRSERAADYHGTGHHSHDPHGSGSGHSNDSRGSSSDNPGPAPADDDHGRHDGNTAAKRGSNPSRFGTSGHDGGGQHAATSGHAWEDWFEIEPVVIPFTVRGNAVATVTAQPDRFMRSSAAPGWERPTS